MTGFDCLHPPLPSTKESRTQWTGLSGSAAALALVAAARRHPAPVLVVTPDVESAERLRQELTFYAGADPELPVMGFPEWETLPYDNFSAHQDIISERLRTLYGLPGLRRGLLVVSFTTLMYRLAPRQYVVGRSLMLARGDRLDLESMRKTLVTAGYQAVAAVAEHGEFAVRGSLLDLFPMGSDQPYRLDLLGDELDSIRTFDPETQRSLSTVPAVQLLPAREYPLDTSGITGFRTRFRDRFDVDVRHCPLYQDVSEGIPSPGLEYYLPLFFDALESLTDYLPLDTLVCRSGDLNDAGQTFWREIQARHADRSVDRWRPILDPTEVFVPVESVFAALGHYPTIELRETEPGSAPAFSVQPLPPLHSEATLADPWQALRGFLTQHADHRVLFCAESAGRREHLLGLLRQLDIEPRIVSGWEAFAAESVPLGIMVAALDRGLWLTDRRLILLSEAQLIGGKIAQRRRRARGAETSEFLIRNLTELSDGDAVVHVEHGVGRYRGLQTLTIDGQATEFLTLEYAGQTRLYVPVASLHLVSRYSGADGDHAPLNQLGNDAWQKTRRKAAERIRDVAAELLEIHARRAARPGHVFTTSEIGLERFAAQFPYEETADQEQAIEAVIQDMSAPRAMDRLICGDVGFGKTEVAMRAAFIAVQNEKQVVVLVPTTLLAQQHFNNFSDRFADWPVRVEVISRFKSAKEQQACLADLANGRIDILIGTHALLNNEMRCADLGLLIIDEEHRFGVRQKERIKALRASVDILTLTATPIPRTLNMALSGVRDLSLIVTPPARRLSVKTFVREENDGLIKEAVTRELLRGGQVFFLHNEVKTIQRAADHLASIVPQARIAVAHGQMPERELERVMSDFYHKRHNVLVCSTIIETGIDIPSANTIIIQRADHFGLAQLHQLRGRVGRSHHQAYAYLLIPHHSQMTPDAHKRIEAIQAASELGAGFTLASHDLEIRGAGEFLGDEQSGHLQKIGFSLYLEMLDAAVRAIRAGRLPSVDLAMESAIDITLRIPALIPETYLPDVHTRLLMYKRIASATGPEELDALQVEMIDRFGLLPHEVKLLFQQTALRLKAQTFGIRKIDANAQTGRIEFGPDTTVDPLSIVQLVQGQPQRYKLAGANQLHFTHQAPEPVQKLAFIDQLLQRLRLVKTQAA